MIASWHPFSAHFEDVIAALEEHLRNGVEQPDQHRFVFQSAVTAYPLPRPAYAIVEVRGAINKAGAVFAPGVDFTFENNQIVWLGPPGKRPDEGSGVIVQFTYRERPSGLTDFNEGSVINTLVRAVAHELTVLYGEMDEAYRRAFIDFATGVALDNVVALLGVQRIPAQKATGIVTFARRTATNRAASISAGTRVVDTTGQTFITTEAASIAAGATSVDVAIEAVQPGPDGNVGSGAITVMPTPPPGVNSVTNAAPTGGGRAAEADEQLRERAKHALERAGNSTLGAIKFAVLGIDGVDGVEVLDFSRDAAIPLGEVRVRYSAGAPDKVRSAVAAVVEATRAAGIHAILEEITSVLISGVFYLIPDVTAQPGAVQTFLQAVSDALDQSPIGAPLSVRRLIALVYGVPGLVDVAEAQLSTPQGPFNDSLLIAPTQQIRPDKTNLKAELLKGLVVPGPTRTSGANRLVDVQLVQDAGTAVSFRNFKLDVQVALRAHSRTIPSQPPELIGVFAHAVTFVNGATGTLTITPDDTSGYRPADHAPDVDVSLSAAAYPGLSGAGTTIRLS